MGEEVADLRLSKELTKSNPNLKFDDAPVSDREMTEFDVLDIDLSDYKSE